MDKQKQYLARCEDCPKAYKKNNILICSECFDQACSAIDDCPDGITFEQVNTINEKMKKVRNNLGARSDKASKPRAKTQKLDQEKNDIVTMLYNILTENEYNDVTIVKPAKLIEFNLNGNHYKLDLIKTRKPKE